MARKIGIVIADDLHIFSNGITQNAFFIKECFEKVGFVCEFLCVKRNPKPFGFRNIPIQYITPDNLELFNPKEYCLIVYTSRRLCKVYYKFLKANNVKVVNFICGNHFIRESEDFILRDASCAFTSDRGDCDEHWIIPSYTFMIDYIKATRGSEGYIVPHLWSPLIINECYQAKYKKHWHELIYKPYVLSRKKIDIIIMEPNLGYIKTSWIPIVVSEKLELSNSQMLNKVFVYNFPLHKGAHDMIIDFKVYDKIIKQNRLAIYDILEQCNKTDTMPVFLSHHYKNSLNYLYYEILYYGYPLVHNSDNLDGCGYYYPENNIGKCVEVIISAYKQHNKQIDTYREKSLNYLKRVDPYDSSVGSIWKQRIQEIVSR